MNLIFSSTVHIVASADFNNILQHFHFSVALKHKMNKWNPSP